VVIWCPLCDTIALMLSHYTLVEFIAQYSLWEYLHNAYMSPALPFLPEGVRLFNTQWPALMLRMTKLEVAAGRGNDP
jgi:hypothetical protein